MCTLIVLHRCVPGFPVVVAANRDEYLDRPAEPPRLRATPEGRIVAPRDLRAGGTWLGVSAAGLFVGITNRPIATPDPARRSRGHVVVDALGAQDAAEAARRAAALPHGAHNPFNLLVADRERAFTVVYDERPEVRELAPGAHVIGNADPDDRAVPKVARLLERAEAAAEQGGEQVVPALAAICRRHEGATFGREDACLHLGGYGTRSSALLLLGARPGSERLWYADGPPCANRYEDFTSLLLELGRTPRIDAGDAAARAPR
jgi:uncharacterized protein with NRDE domain